MEIRGLKDRELLFQLKNLVSKERLVLTEVLHHLREVDRRRLYCDLGFGSLFDYCVRELGYSEGQACRRIAGMRLLREIPEIESKISSGVLSLSNISQAQSFFRENKISGAEKKISLLKELENCSAREGKKVIVEKSVTKSLPKEKERIVSESCSVVSFPMDASLRQKLEEVRSLLGVSGGNISMANLIEKMADVSIQSLKKAKLGQSVPSTSGVNTRYIPKIIKREVWERDKGCCQNCGGRRYLNFDHIKPFALGGKSDLENLRLLCFSCNQRRGVQSFGVRAV